MIVIFSPIGFTLTSNTTSICLDFVSFASTESFAHMAVCRTNFTTVYANLIKKLYKLGIHPLIGISFLNILIGQIIEPALYEEKKTL